MPTDLKEIKMQEKSKNENEASENLIEGADVPDYVPLDDLEASQTVLNDETNRLVRRNKTAVFVRPGSAQDYLDALTTASQLTTAQLEFSVFDISIFTEDGGLTKFWGSCGQNVTTLELRIFTKATEFWPELGDILENDGAPNLETLVFPHLMQLPDTSRLDTRQQQNNSMETLRIELFDEGGRNVERLAEILKTLPNLQVIDVIDKYNTSSLSTLISVLAKPEVSLPHLRRLITKMTVNQEDLNDILQADIPLQQLHITLEDGVKASSFKSLISLLEPTLSELKVKFPDYFSENPKTPEEHPEEFICLLTNLRSLHLVNFKWPKEFVMKLPTCFPHLRCLHIPEIDDERLRVIYQSLPILSELEFSNAKCTDWGLTGISQEICNDMLQTGFLYEGAERHRTDLYIGSLPFLKKLAVIGPRLTDASVAFGLADCRNMTELKVGSSLISDKGIIFLVDRLGRNLNFFDVSACTELTDDTRSYVAAMTGGTAKMPSFELTVRNQQPKRARVELKDRDVSFHAL